MSEIAQKKWQAISRERELHVHDSLTEQLANYTCTTSQFHKNKPLRYPYMPLPPGNISNDMVDSCAALLVHIVSAHSLALVYPSYPAAAPLHHHCTQPEMYKLY